MTEYPYTKIQSNLRKFFQGIPKRGVPEIIDREYLKQTGFRSLNDIGMISVLSFIKFIDEQSKPTDDYINFRINAKQEVTMTSALKQAYSELFQLYPDAHQRTKQELTDFFTPTTTSGEAVVRLTVGIFLILCEFSAMKPPAPAKTVRTVKIPKAKVAPKKKEESVEKGVIISSKKTPQVVVNIQIVLPESKDSSLYDELFKSLKKYILE